MPFTVTVASAGAVMLSVLGSGFMKSASSSTLSIDLYSRPNPASPPSWGDRYTRQSSVPPTDTRYTGAASVYASSAT